MHPRFPNGHRSVRWLGLLPCLLAVGTALEADEPNAAPRAPVVIAAQRPPRLLPVADARDASLTADVLLRRVSTGQPADAPQLLSEPLPESIPAPAYDPLQGLREVRGIGDLTIDRTPQEPAGTSVRPHASEAWIDDQATVRYGSGFPGSSFTGQLAAPICHRPLYFEEINLERYGTYRPGIQSTLSGMHFFGRVLTLPYHMTLDKPNRVYYYPRRYTTGLPAPWERQRPVLQAKPALVEASVVAGLIWLLP